MRYWTRWVGPKMLNNYQRSISPRLSLPTKPMVGWHSIHQIQPSHLTENFVLINVEDFQPICYAISAPCGTAAQSPLSWSKLTRNWWTWVIWSDSIKLGPTRTGRRVWLFQCVCVRVCLPETFIKTKKSMASHSKYPLCWWKKCCTSW